jgi:hypothetical protein
MKITNFISTAFILFVTVQLAAQQIPSPEENISYLTTFGKDAGGQWGDDDHVQSFFFIIPASTPGGVFIKVFDPNIGGLHDVVNKDEVFNTQTKFMVYGGKGAYTDPDSQGIDPKGNYKAGTLLASETFDQGEYFDDTWFSFGPFNPTEGEYVAQFDGYVFKVIAQGLDGDDGNHYKYFLSSDKTTNRPVIGGNAFTFEYTFKLPEGRGSVAHIYPLMDENVIAIKQNNFDFDVEGVIKVYSISKNGHNVMLSPNEAWEVSEHKIDSTEHGKSLDIQIVKSKDRINDMTFFIVNQYNEAIPFFAIPIGGVPKYKYKVAIQYNYSRHPTTTKSRK